jgi:hypothetical protein
MINFQLKGPDTCSAGQIFTGNDCYGNKNYNKSIVSNTSAFKTLKSSICFIKECGNYDINASNGPSVARIFIDGGNIPFSTGVVVSKFAILTVASVLMDASSSSFVSPNSVYVFLGVANNKNPRYVHAVAQIIVSSSKIKIFATISRIFTFSFKYINQDSSGFQYVH